MPVDALRHSRSSCLLVRFAEVTLISVLAPVCDLVTSLFIHNPSWLHFFTFTRLTSSTFQPIHFELASPVHVTATIYRDPQTPSKHIVHLISLNTQSVSTPNQVITMPITWDSQADAKVFLPIYDSLPSCQS